METKAEDFIGRLFYVCTSREPAIKRRTNANRTLSEIVGVIRILRRSNIKTMTLCAPARVLLVDAILVFVGSVCRYCPFVCVLSHLGVRESRWAGNGVRLEGPRTLLPIRCLHLSSARLLGLPRASPTLCDV